MISFSLENLIKEDKMKTKLYMNIIPLSFLIFSSILINSCSTMDKNKSEIGAILPLTGSSSYLGQSVLDGMKIAFEDFNKLNKTDYVFDPYDYQGKISSVNNIYQLTKTKDNPNLVLSWMSSVASALVQNTEKDNTLLFVGAAKPELTENTKFVIRLWPNAIDLANIESDFAINKLKCKNVGIFYINDDYGLALANQFSQKLNDAKVNIVFKDAASADVTDYRNIILKFKNKNIDLIYIAAYDQTYTYIIKQVRQYLPNINILTDLTFCNYQNIKNLENIGEGVYTVGTEIDNQTTSNSSTKQLMERINKDYHHNADFNTGLGYDMAWVALQALNNTDGKPQTMKDYIVNKKNFNGKSGNIVFEPSGNAKFNLYLLQLHNGRLLEVK